MERPELIVADDLNEFVRSMPPSYARLFDRAEMREHQRIAAARGQRTAHAALWPSRSGEGTAICVVTETRSGVLSLISDALSSQDLDVTAAHVQRRSVGTRRETLVFVWVVRESDSLQAPRVELEELREFTLMLEQLVKEQERADELLRVSGEKLAGRPEQARVYYDTRAMRSGEYVLVVEAPDCPGLLLAVTRALFRQHAEIVASEVRTEEGLARDRFTISGASGTPLTPDRLADVQQGVLFAVRRLVARQFGGEWSVYAAE